MEFDSVNKMAQKMEETAHASGGDMRNDDTVKRQHKQSPDKSNLSNQTKFLYILLIGSLFVVGSNIVESPVDGHVLAPNPERVEDRQVFVVPNTNTIVNSFTQSDAGITDCLGSSIPKTIHGKNLTL
jgi:hypothetical protein